MKKETGDSNGEKATGRILARVLADDLRRVEGGGGAAPATVDKSSDGHTDITNGTGDHDVNDN